MSTSTSIPQQAGPSVVAHVVVVGFHAQLGNRIEFAYPRLRGDPILRSPRIWDTSDISAEAASPTIVRRATPTHQHKFDTPQKDSDSDVPASPVSDWGVLPEEWAFLPFMAMPDGVHDHDHDLVFFTLPPDVHCVACFRQVDADAAKTHSAASGRSYENSVAARGSVQKSIVLLCRRPLFGVLAERLIPAVRAYFDQADFANTDVLASLFHSLNVSLSRPSLANSDTLFHGLDLRSLIRRLGPQTLAVLKLIMLECRVIIYSQPVSHASNAAIALASIFPGALDAIAPSLRPLDNEKPELAKLGLPLSLFGPSDRIILQPYAPLPLVSDLIPNFSARGCLIATSHNVGLLLSNTAAVAARKAATARRTSNIGVSPLDVIARVPLPSETTPLAIPDGPPNPSANVTPEFGVPSNGDGAAAPSPSARRMSGLRTASPSRGRGGVPVVDALVNMANGKVSVSALLEPICRITRQERRFMRDLMVAANSSSGSTSSSGTTGPFIGSDDYIRGRLRDYLAQFLRSVATVPGVIGGPIGAETWSAELVEAFQLSGFEAYNEQFVKAWLTTRNGAQWARRCDGSVACMTGPPAPELEESFEDALPSVERVAAGLSGLRQNVAEFGRFSSAVSAKAAEGLSSFFKRIELEVAKMDSAVEAATGVGAFGARPRGTVITSRPEPQEGRASDKEVSASGMNGAGVEAKPAVASSNKSVERPALDAESDGDLSDAQR